MNHDEFEYNDDDSSWDEGVVIDDGPGYSVFKSVPLPNHGMIRSPMSPRLDGVNLGTTVEFASNEDGYPVPASEWLAAASVNPDFSLVALERILTVQPKDLESQAPGSWVVSLSGMIVESSSVDNPDSYSEYTPLVAKVTYGSGGASQYFMVDAWRSIFSVPSNNFIVEVGWMKPGCPGIANQGQGIIIPDLVKVTATAHRSLETGEAVPTITYNLNSQNAGTPYRLTMSVPIPPQAVSWALGARYPIPPGSSILVEPILITTTDSLVPTTAVPLTYDSVDNTTALAMIKNRCFRELPSPARFITFDINTAALDEPRSSFSLAFRLGV